MKKIILLFCLFFIAQIAIFGQVVSNTVQLEAEILAFNGMTSGTKTITFTANILTPSSAAFTTINNTTAANLIIEGANFSLSRANTLAINMLSLALNTKVTIRNLTIDGALLVVGFGSGINNAGNLTLDNCIIKDNVMLATSTQGSGIANSGILILNKCKISGNTLSGTNNVLGAGIYNAGTATIDNSIIELNVINSSSAVSPIGAGVFNSLGGTLTLTNSTINNNEIRGFSAGASGAGIYHVGTLLDIKYCTVSGNKFSGSFSGATGGGIRCDNAFFTIANCTVFNNGGSATAGGGFLSGATGGTIRNSLFLDNTGANIQYLAGFPTVMSNNIATSVAGFTPTAPQIINGVASTNILDGTLKDNGGFTPTHALLANNANLAIEGGTAIIGLTTDQRGESFLGTVPDIGAYEFGSFWVTNDNNTGVNSLRQAITDVNVAIPALADLNGIIPNRTIKFKIPSLTPLCSLTFALPTIDKPVIIDASTQKTLVSGSAKVEINGTFITSGNGLTINQSAARTEIYGLSFRSFSAGISNNADNVIIGSSATNKGNIFQACAVNGVLAANGNNTIIENNYFGLLETGLAGTANSNYDIWVGGVAPMTGVTIKNNVLGATNGGISFGTTLTNTVTTTTILNNRIGFDINNTNITGNPAGIHTNAGTNGIVIENNAIGNRALAAGIVIMPNTSSVIIRTNKIGMAESSPYNPAPCQTGIEVGNNITNGLTIDGNYIGSTTDAIKLSPNTYVGTNACSIQNNFIGMAPDNTTKTNNVGIRLGTGLTALSGIGIENNYVGNSSTYGIYANALQNSTINNNKIGLAPVVAPATSEIAAPNDRGLAIDGTMETSQSLTITNNVISGNIKEGVEIIRHNAIATPATIFTANKIGTNILGDAVIPNTTGILIQSGAAGLTISTNTISGNTTGINIASSNTTIIANKIGLNSLGNEAIPNTTSINIGTGLSGITIGGANSTDGNSFAATNIGILSNSPCIIANNTFGTNAIGTAALSGFTGFSAQAISINYTTVGSSSIDNNVIGGARNTSPITIVGNNLTGSASAILIAANNVEVTNNKIGITSNDVAIPNDIGISTQVGINTSNCFIGNLGQGNIISNNKNAAIYLASNIAFSAPIGITFNTIGMNLAGTSRSSLPTIFGIAAETSASAAIDLNTINNTTNSAISLLSIRNTIRDTKIGEYNPDPITNPSFNTVAGINVTTNCTISANVIQNCAGVGIQISGSFNTMDSGNQIFDNLQQGINIKNGNGNRIGENSIYNNGNTATPNPKGIDLNLPTVAIQGNNGQPAPIITSATILPGNQMTISGTASPDGSHFCYFYRTTTTDVGGNADLVEGKEYIGQATITVTGGMWTTTIMTQVLTPAISPTDFITVNTQYSPMMGIQNTSEFSPAFLLCSTTITGITTQNSRTTCAGSLTDVRINLTTTTNISNLFDVDIDGNGNGNYEYLNIALQSDANGKFLLLRDVSGISFNNTKLLDQFATCTSAAFVTQNPVIIQNSALPRPTIISARTVQSTSCTTPNGQLIVKIQNGVIGQNYELSTNGVFGAEYSVLFLGTDSTLRVTLGLTENVRDLQVYQAGNQCISTTFPFSSQMVAPLQNIDSTLNVVLIEDEISPNFNTAISLLNAQDSISYRLFNRTLNKFAGIAQRGNANATLNFNTDTLLQVGNYVYEIIATSIRTGCSRNLAKTATVKVISGILAEELDVLREVYTSTNGDFWTTKWDFAKNISTFLGVSVFGGRVKTILLPSNNLSGKLTTKVLNLRKLNNLDIGNNSLDFGSVEPFINRTFAFNYKIQANINRQIDTTVYANTKMELAVITAGTQNKYQWTKDNVIIPNANFATLTFDALKLTDAGLYTCLVSNSLGTALILERRSILLKVNIKNISASDSTLLIKINDELGGGNWTNKWDRSKPVAEWYGITMTGDKITSINLANNNLVGVIPNIIPLTSNILSDLTYLNLSGNRISGEIPKSLGNLSKLQYLDLSNNLLVGDVILELGKLQDLKNLLLSYNTFKAVHADLGKLIKLENLFLNNNNIATIPAEIGNLKALQTLNFSNNLLKTIPTNLGLLTNLVTLGLANNQITSVADIFNNLQSLHDLSLQNNELTALPTSFIRLRNLKTLLLHTNFLDFADFELLATLPILNATGAIYEPQAKVGTNQNILFTLDQALNLMQNVNGTANTFQWFKNGVAIGISANPLQTRAIYLADGGVYTLQIQNTIARKLTLVSYDIVVKVSCGNATSVRINIVGTSRYCEGETINTLLSADVNQDVQVVGYQWFRNNSRLNGENQKNLSIIQEGLYSLQVSDKNNCAFLSKPIAIQVLPKPRINVVRKGDTLTVNITQSNGKLQYVWYKDNTQMVEAKTTFIVARANGTYYVIVTDSTSCPTKSPIINLTITGIEDEFAELAKQITVYPNPTDAKITVILPENFTISKLKIYNMLGQVVLENSQKQIINNIKNFDNKSNSLIINIENFVSGSYLLELQNEKGTIIRKKLVKQ